MMKTVLSIDPGLTCTGMCSSVFDGTSLLIERVGCVHTNAVIPLPERMNYILREVCQFEMEYCLNPDIVIIEDCVIGLNAKGAMKQSELIGVLWSHYGNGRDECSMYRINPTDVKMEFTGIGNAKKPAMMAEAESYFGFKLEGTKPEREAYADAIAIAYSGLIKMGEQCSFGIKLEEGLS